jgi:DNA-binding IclR family transcriptional regulator
MVDYRIHVLSEALRVLEVVGRNDGQLSLSELSDASGLTKSKVFRVLFTLEESGYLRKPPGSSCYALGPTVLYLGMLASGRYNLPILARPHMQRLLAGYGETVILAMFDGASVIQLDLLESTHRIRVAQPDGTRSSPHTTSLGKAILAHLLETELSEIIPKLSLDPETPNSITSMERFLEELRTVRAQGYAIDNEESLLGARCVGAPIFGPAGKVVAAMSIEGPSERLSLDAIEAIGPVIRGEALECSRALGFNPPSS